MYRSRTANNEDTYGVVFHTQDGAALTLSDVDPNREVALAIAERLAGEEADEEQLRYLAEDMLGAFYNGECS